MNQIDLIQTFWSGPKTFWKGGRSILQNIPKILKSILSWMCSATKSEECELKVVAKALWGFDLLWFRYQMWASAIVDRVEIKIRTSETARKLSALNLMPTFRVVVWTLPNPKLDNLTIQMMNQKDEKNIKVCNFVRIFRCWMWKLCYSMAIHSWQQLGNVFRWYGSRWMWTTRRVPSMQWYFYW